MEYLFLIAAFLSGFAAGAFAAKRTADDVQSADFTLSDEDAETVRQYVNFLKYDGTPGGCGNVED